MPPWDAAGYLASGLVVAAFCMKDVVLLRAIALTSNMAFLTYGVARGLAPVWMLHAILLPINAWRLWEGLSERCRRPAAVRIGGGMARPGQQTP